MYMPSATVVLNDGTKRYAKFSLTPIILTTRNPDTYISLNGSQYRKMDNNILDFLIINALEVGNLYSKEFIHSNFVVIGKLIKCKLAHFFV